MTGTSYNEFQFVKFKMTCQLSDKQSTQHVVKTYVIPLNLRGNTEHTEDIFLARYVPSEQIRQQHLG